MKLFDLAVDDVEWESEANNGVASQPRPAPECSRRQRSRIPADQAPSQPPARDLNPRASRRIVARSAGGHGQDAHDARQPPQAVARLMPGSGCRVEGRQPAMRVKPTTWLRMSGNRLPGPVSTVTGCLKGHRPSSPGPRTSRSSYGSMISRTRTYTWSPKRHRRTAMGPGGLEGRDQQPGT